MAPVEDYFAPHLRHAAGELVLTPGNFVGPKVYELRPNMTIGNLFRKGNVDLLDHVELALVTEECGLPVFTENDTDIEDVTFAELVEWAYESNWRELIVRVHRRQA